MRKTYQVSDRRNDHFVAESKFEEITEELRRLDGEVKMLKRRSGGGEGEDGEPLPANSANALYDELSLLRAELCSKAQFEEFKQSASDKLKDLQDLAEKNERAAKKNYDFII